MLIDMLFFPKRIQKKVLIVDTSGKRIERERKVGKGTFNFHFLLSEPLSIFLTCLFITLKVLF